MVSYFDDNFGKRANPYAECSLAEACFMAESNINEMCSDLEMSVLLNEHAFLLENGYEIEYMTLDEEAELLQEAKKSGWDKASETVSGLKNKVIIGIKKLIATISDVIDRFAIWASSKITQLFANLSILNKNAIEDGYKRLTKDKVESDLLNKIAVKMKYTPKVSYGDLVKFVSRNSKFSLITKLDKVDPQETNTTAKEVFEALMREVNASDAYVLIRVFTPATIFDAIGTKAQKGYSKAIKTAIDQKKKATNSLGQAISKVKNKSEEEVSKSIKKYTWAIKHNIAVTHGTVKAWTAFINAAAAAARLYAGLGTKKKYADKLDNAKDKARRIGDIMTED